LQSAGSVAVARPLNSNKQGRADAAHSASGGRTKVRLSASPKPASSHAVPSSITMP